MNKYTINNGDIVYTITEEKKEFLVVKTVGDKKSDFLDYFYDFLSPDCPPINPSKDISRNLYKHVIEPLENDKTLIFDIDLFFKFGKWATYKSNFHVCRGASASKILSNILGIKILRSDISTKNYRDYYPLSLEEMFSNIVEKINNEKTLVITPK